MVEQLRDRQFRDDTNQDLQAQKSMSYWAGWNFVVSFAGLIVSVVGLFVVWASLKQTRAAISNDREVGHAQVRAYIAVDLFPPDVLPGKAPNIIFNMKNTGQSPAYKLRYISVAKILDASPVPISVFVEGDIRGEVGVGQTLAAGGVQRGNVCADFEMTKEIFDQLRVSAARRFFITIKVFYDDVFGIFHQTSVCAYAAFNQTKNKEGVFTIEWELADEFNSAT